MTQVVLASASRVRAAVLAAAGVAFTVEPANVDEGAEKTALASQGADPATMAQVLADRKALKVSGRQPGWIIGADQVLEVRGAVMDKSETLRDARDRLASLRGRTHRLHAAVALARKGQVVWRSCETAHLTMRRFSDAFLDAYLASEGDAILGSMGYRIEGAGVQLFSKVRGDYFAILGLPLCLSWAPFAHAAS